MTAREHNRRPADAEAAHLQKNAENSTNYGRARLPRPVLLGLLAVLAAGAMSWWWLRGQARPLPEPPLARLQCVSYAPYRLPGETPHDPTARVDEARIEADLRLLQARTSCVRTYTVGEGLDAVPAVARRLGMTVLMGAWLGRDRDRNARELTSAIALARANRDVVRALIVGNEVLLRRELPATDLAQLLARAKREAGVPVTYADVWEFWVRNAQLAQHVDFLTVHILPYWEDEPVGVAQALDHVVDIHRHVRETFPGREILIGETGWPSIGRARRDAVPGRVEQAAFVRGFVAAAAERGIRYNLIEGFDQPWKRGQEGAMGGGWGMLGSDGAPKFPWTGPVSADPRWTDGLVAALASAFAFGALSLARGRRGAAALSAHLLAGLAVGAVLMAQWRYMVDWNRTPVEWAASGAWTVMAALLGWLAVERLVDGRTGALPAGADAARRSFGGRRSGRDDAVALLRLAVLFGAAVMTVLLVFDARYRGFPWPLYAIPAAALALLAVAGDRPPRSAAEERLLSAVVAVGVPVVAVMERAQSAQAWAWLAVAACLAYGGWSRPGRPGALGEAQAASAASRAPTAEGSKQ